MNVSVVTTKGQVVIPARLRRSLNIKQGTRLSFVEKDKQIIMQPLTEDYFEKTAGIFNTKGRLSRALLEDRAADKEAENRK